MRIEWATDNDALAIQELMRADGLFMHGGNWTGLGRTWLVARDDEGVKACMAYHPGRPFARLDFLSIDKSVTDKQRVRVVRDILEAAFAVSALHGSSFVTGLVPYYLPDYGEFLAKRGGQKMNEGWLFMAALSDVIERRNEANGRRFKNHNDDNGHADGGRERVHTPAD